MGALEDRRLGPSKGPIYDALAQLEEAGVLIPLSRSNRNRSWEADGLLDLLEALEAGEPAEAEPGED